MDRNNNNNTAWPRGSTNCYEAHDGITTAFPLAFARTTITSKSPSEAVFIVVDNAMVLDVNYFSPTLSWLDKYVKAQQEYKTRHQS
jgi:hypothetical protein